MLPSAPTTDPSYFEPSTQFQDSIANICWYPSEPSPAIAVSSWDSKITIYRGPLSENGNIVSELNSFSTEYPCLALTYMPGSGNLIVGSIDGKIFEVNPWSGSVVKNIGKHDDAVQAVYIYESLICSVSYDSTLKFWDYRGTGSPISSFDLGAKVVCSDMTYPNLLIGYNNQKFQPIDLRHLSTTQRLGPHLETTLGVDSPLSDVSISKEGAIGLGSSSGRSGISWVQPNLFDSFSMTNTYCFKGHKLDAGQGAFLTNKTIMYPINAVGMHPKNKDTYFTAGRDGCVHFWNIAKRSRIGGFSWNGVPITKAKWSPDGKYLAYGVGYDWSSGIEGAESHKTKFCVHLVQDRWLAKP